MNPHVKEWLIARWHGIIDYGNKPKRSVVAKREEAKEKRDLVTQAWDERKAIQAARQKADAEVLSKARQQTIAAEAAKSGCVTVVPTETIISDQTNNRLIQCPDCGNGVSRRAPSCPQCGMVFWQTKKESAPAPAPVIVNIKNNNGCGCGTIILLLLALFIAWILFQLGLFII